MSTTADYYKVLGVDSKATPAEIKTAYHSAAKRAHPDTGGSQAEMERLNHAYQVLSSPLARREYDATLHAPGHPHPRTHATAHPAAHPDQRQQRNEVFTHIRFAAWQNLKTSLILAILIGFATRFLALISLNPNSRLILSSIGFLPVYAVIVNIVFLISPELRLNLYHFMHPLRLRPTREDYLVTVGFVLAFFVLAVFWLKFF